MKIAKRNPTVSKLLFLPLLFLGGISGLAQTQTPTTTAGSSLGASPMSITPVVPTITQPTPADAARQIASSRGTPAGGNFPEGTVKYRLPLRNLIDSKSSIIMRNDRSIYTLFLPVASRYQVLRCRLHLDYTNSISLLAHRSVMAISVNDRILHQVRLDPQFPSDSIVIDIPASLLNNDFNQVQFYVAQRSTEKCQDPNSPELYTQIDPDLSYFEAELLPQPVPQRLSALRDIIDEKLWYPYSFHICVPDSAAKEESVLSWGSIITQGVGLAIGVQPFRVTHASALRPGVDNIVVGTMNSLSQFLTATEIGAINGSFIGVKQLRDDPRHYMIVISGRSEEEVGQAALAFAMINYPLPDAQYAQIDRLAFPDRAMYIRNAPLSLPGSYQMNRLGYKTRTIKGFNTGAVEIPMYMPGDLSPYDQSNVELRLNFAYGAASRADSTLNFFVNEVFHSAVHLRQTEGALHNNHKIFIPTKGFQPGRNVLRILPLLVPLVTDECELDQVENLLFTLYDDSSIVVPGLARGAILPSLGLLSQTGFPYTASPDGVDASVFITAREPDAVNAAWTLMGKIAQISGTLLHRTELTYRPTRSKRNLLVVGPVQAIPDEVVQGMSVSPREIGQYRYMVSTNPKPGSALPSGLEEFLNRVRGKTVESAIVLETPSVVEANAVASLEEKIVVVQSESPFHLGYANTIVTASTSSKLLAGLNVLQQRDFWDNLTGDLASWDMDPESLAVAKVGKEFTYGASSVVERARQGLGRQPFVFAVVVILALALVGILARMVLSQRKRQMENQDLDK